MNRQEILDHLRVSPEVDVLIIGGGVNGIGTFRELALNGVNVLLVEKGDFCSGASAASSHMLHGGIRYLENGEFRLVREALHERNRLLKNAPHYAKPLPTTIPMFRWVSGLLNAPLKFIGVPRNPAERGAVVIKAGLEMYDLFTGADQTMPYHKFEFRKQSLQKFPRLNPDVICTATYYDAWMPYPERLCYDMIRDAEAAHEHAHAVNYLAATDGKSDTVILSDELTGNTLPIKPKVVVNAAGPWIDFVNKALNQKTEFIGGTKGSHLVLDHPELLAATKGHEFFFENDDGRIVLIFPFMGRVMVGTTDERIDNPDEAICTEADVEYILGLVNKVFPTIRVDRSQIVFTFSGVRPLPSADGRTGAISRDHSINTIGLGHGLRFPVHSLVGGKWTSFRAFSEETADLVLENLGKQRSVDTKTLAIGGGKAYPQTETVQTFWLDALHDRTQIPRDHLQTLFNRYGTYVKAVADFCAAETDTPLENVPNYSKREIMFIVQNEKVVQLDDLLLRRSLIAMLGLATEDGVKEIGAIMGETLGWSKRAVNKEVKRVITLFQEKYPIKDFA